MADNRNLRKLNESELFWYIRDNVNYVNQQLTTIEKSEKDNESNAYRYVQNKLRNRTFMTFNKNGDVRFQAKSKEIRNLNHKELYAMAQYIQNYKNTETGTLYKLKRLQQRTLKTLNESLASHGMSEVKQSDLERLFKGADWDKNLRSSDRLFQIVDKYGVDVARFWIDELGKGQSILEEEKELHAKYDELHKNDRGEEETSDFSGNLFP